VSYDGRRKVVVLNVNATEAEVKQIRLHEAYSNAAVGIQPGPAGTFAECPVAASEGWFDIVIESEGDPGYLRRFAGHLEDGAPSRSDPGPPSSAAKRSLA
jgi:phospholipase C